LLIKAYGRARREEEALAVFEEMLDAGVRWIETTSQVLFSVMMLDS
jgi:pentatricopeptide repeat protein